MKFAGDDSHVRRVRKSDIGKRGYTYEGKNASITESRYKKEWYVVEKDYKDPFTGEYHKKGDLIPNRQGRNVQAQERGNYRSISQYQRIWSPNASRKNALVRSRDRWLREGSRASGRSVKELREDPKVRQAWTQLYMIDNGRKDKDPNGALAQMLVAMGLRSPNATYPVGETPKRSSRKAA